MGGSPSILRICLNLMVINCENAEKRKKRKKKRKSIRSFSLFLLLLRPPVGAYLRSYSPISCFGVYTSIVFEAHQTLFLSDRTFLTRILFFFSCYLFACFFIPPVHFDNRIIELIEISRRCLCSYPFFVTFWEEGFGVSILFYFILFYFFLSFKRGIMTRRLS